MVLSKGELLQFDTPANLLRDEAGYFVSIAAHSAKLLVVTLYLCMHAAHTWLHACGGLGR
eukprot:COSAG02_NODE_1449_length_12567_cov_4.622474_4_plen_60_part_00